MTSHRTILTCAICFAVSIAACTGQGDRGDAASEKTAESGSVTVGAVEFQYFIEGTGKPLLVVGDAWPPARASSEKLRDHFMFVVMDSRMNIPSDRQGPIDQITMATLVDDIEAMRSELRFEDVCVLGHSINGILALEYARKYPEHVSCVIMHATPPYWNEGSGAEQSEFLETRASDERKEILRHNWEIVTEDSLSGLDSSEAGKLRYITNGPIYWHDPAYDASWILEGVYWNQEVWNQLFGAIMPDYDLTGEGTVTAPVFLAIGQSDYAVPYFLWDEEREKLPNLSYNLFEKSGHYPMLEEQELFDRLLLEWVAGL